MFKFHILLFFLKKNCSSFSNVNLIKHYIFLIYSSESHIYVSLQNYVYVHISQKLKEHVKTASRPNVCRSRHKNYCCPGWSKKSETGLCVIRK